MGNVLIDLAAAVSENLLTTVVVLLWSSFALVFIKKWIDEEYDDIALALAHTLFDIAVFWCWLTRVDTREEIDHDIKEAFELATESGRGKFTTAIGLTFAYVRIGTGQAVHDVAMGTTRAYAIAGVSFLAFYRADGVQKWKLLRFVAKQRRRARGLTSTARKSANANNDTDADTNDDIDGDANVEADGTGDDRTGTK